MKGRTLKLAIVAALLIFIPGLQAQSIGLTGYVRNYTGVLLNGDNEYSIIQNTLNLNVEQSKDKIAFKANPYIYQYPNQEMEIGLREAYLDIYFNSVDVRIGKQQIIWGKADGVFITDIVSPKDLSEFENKEVFGYGYGQALKSEHKNKFDLEMFAGKVALGQNPKINKHDDDSTRS